MKKARIILSAVTLLALTSGIFAFKTSKFNGQRAFTIANIYTTNGMVYTRAASALLPITPAQFITGGGGGVTTVHSTTSIVPGTITLTQVGGTATITFPVYQGFEIAGTFTTGVN